MSGTMKLSAYRQLVDDTRVEVFHSFAPWFVQNTQWRGLERAVHVLVRHRLPAHQPRAARAYLKAITAQLAFENLYPFRKEPPCPTH